MRMILAIAALLPLGVTAAQAQQPVTVKSLLAQEFAAHDHERGRGGVFLQKKDKLFFCNVTETPTSTTLATRYCKPVE